MTDLAVGSPASAADGEHRPPPLAPLTAGEVATAARVLRAELALPPSTRLVRIALQRPARALVVARQAGAPGDRDALIVVEDRGLDATYEAVVAVDEGFVRSYRRLGTAGERR